jgi:hypothetical protein
MRKGERWEEGGREEGEGGKGEVLTLEWCI